MFVFLLLLVFTAGYIFLGRSVTIAVFAGAFALDLLYCCIMNFVGAVRNNTPVRRPVPHNKDGEPSTRSFAFGMGYYKIICVWKNCLQLSLGVWYVENNFGIFDKYGQKKELFEDSVRGVEKPRSAFDIIVWFVISLVYAIVIWQVSLVLCLASSLIFLSLTFVYTIVNLPVLLFVKVSDKILLSFKRVKTDCPQCHIRVTVPAYICPKCGAVHKKLLPNRYGIWKHYCRCGEKLPSTVIGGRSHLDAVCPTCGTEIFASDMRPISIQLIGGTMAGKSMYLASFFNMFTARIYKSKTYRTIIPRGYSTVFEELASWRRDGECPATSEMNSQMYPLVIKAKKGKQKRRFAIYDVAGEVFGSSEDFSEYQQRQYGYVDGFLFIVDPFSSGNLRIERQQAGKDVSEFSNMPSSTVVENFSNYLIRNRITKPNEIIKTPIAVIISKSDIDEVRREIGPEVIESRVSEFRSYDEARDCICRDFLMLNGFANTVNSLETQFSTIHFYPVSAIGHSAGSECTPWGVLEPVDWMIKKADSGFAKKIGII